jgi:hypothetical protein
MTETLRADTEETVLQSDVVAERPKKTVVADIPNKRGETGASGKTISN